MDAWTKADDGMNLRLSDYVDAPTVEVTMFPTREYVDAVGREMSPCTLESKCNGSCQ